MQQALKKSLSYTWAKASDLKETYEFNFSGRDLACVRSNPAGDRRFRLSFDAEGNRLWWGESYFLDPNDLKEAPERAKWYRAADTAKRHVAFAWHRREARPLPPEAFAPAARPSSKAAPPASSAAAQAKGKAVPKILTKASAKAPAAKVAPPAKEPKERPARLREGRALPEVILDLQEVFVIYKPPHWRCELPSKDALREDPEAGRGQRDPLLLLRWIREKLPTIEPDLFEEDFNPALSGTGFGPLSHRIDQETSGPMLVARTRQAQRHLKSQFHKTEVSKRYLCLVHGRVSKPSGVIEASIRTYRTDSLTLSEVSSSGEWAYTAYQVVATYGPLRGAGQGGFTLVACEIKTGRTHQIRVHMQHLGHSLVSDDKYLSEERLSEDRTWCPRLFLHCYRLGFRSTEGDFETVVCPLPQDLKTALLRLGAADPTGLSSDTLYNDNSWQREIFRPPLSQWQPATRALRRAVALLSAAPGPLSLAELGADAELRRLLAEEEGVSSPGRSWLSKHWRCFEATSRQAAGGGGSELCVRLRPEHAAGAGDEEHDLERRIEAVRSELEELQRQKQRAVAEEEYQRAAEIKKRLEASHAELDSLLSFAELEGDDGSLAGPRAGGLDHDFDADRGRGRRGLPEPPRREAFKQDVRDEALFPSLVPAKHPPKRPAASSLGPASRAGAAAAPAANRAASASHFSSAASAAAAGGSAAAAAGQPQEEDEEEQESVLSLKDALLEFLQKRDGSVAHINEVNNDKYLRQVMAAQVPKPMASVNKAWLKQHDGVFALLRTEDNEMYIAINQVVKAKVKAAAARTATAVPKNPAYHQVVQKTAAGDAAPPLRYSYNAATRKEDASAAAAKEPGGNSVAASWQDKFLAALGEVPQKSRSAEELLQCVPLFAEAMGTKKIREQKELLVMFLEGFPDIFKVEKRGSGAERQYVIWAR